MRFCRVLSQVIFLTLIFYVPVGYSEGVRFITEPTMNMDESGRSISAESELTRDLMRRLGVSGDVKVYPWKRAYALMLKGPNIALYPTTRTEARENDAKWVGPIAKVSWVFFADKDSDIELNSLEDAMNVGRICGYLGDAKLTFLEKKGFKNLVPQYRTFDCIELLIKDRVDLWISTSNAVITDSAANPYRLSDLKIVYTIKEKYLYYALSKDTPDETVELLQTTVDAMKKEGVFYKYLTGHYAEGMIREISQAEKPAFTWLINE